MDVTWKLFHIIDAWSLHSPTSDIGHGRPLPLAHFIIKWQPNAKEAAAKRKATATAAATVAVAVTVMAMATTTTESELVFQSFATLFAFQIYNSELVFVECSAI